MPTKASNDHLLFASFADSNLTCYLCKYFQFTFLVMHLVIFVAAIITFKFKNWPTCVHDYRGKFYFTWAQQNWIFYRPRQSCGQGYVFTRVCDSVNRGGVCLSACWDTANPVKERPPHQGDLPRRRPPAKETPCPCPQAHTQGGNWGGSGPGPHPRGKLRGVRSRHTPKGEIEGDQIQAHTQGGNWGGSDPRPPPPHHTVNERPVRILLECILVIHENTINKYNILSVIY